MLIVGEPLDHRFGDHLTDAVYFCKTLHAGRSDGIDRAELTSQRLRGGRTHMSDGQCDDDPPQRPAARGVHVREHDLRVLT